MKTKTSLNNQMQSRPPFKIHLPNGVILEPAPNPPPKNPAARQTKDVLGKPVTDRFMDCLIAHTRDDPEGTIPSQGVTLEEMRHLAKLMHSYTQNVEF